MGINFAMVAVVSRLLRPDEIGLSVLGMAIVAPLVAMREFTTTAYLIQQKDLTRDQVRVCVTMLLLLTALICSTVAMSAHFVASAYRELQLAPFLYLVCAALLAEVVSAPIVALMRRDLAFGKVAIINVAGVASSALIAVLLAAHGFSHMSFAWAWLTAAVVTGVLAMSFRPDFWMFRPSLRQWPNVAAYCGSTGVNAVLSNAYDQLPYLLLGRFVSFGAVGLYNRSLTVCQLPNKILLGGAAPVIFPAFSWHVRDGCDLKRPYLWGVEFITGIRWPALVVVAILAHPVVLVLYGDAWLATVPLVRIIALASLFSFAGELNGPVLAAVGATRDIFIRGIVIWPVSGIVITCASFSGVEALAMSLFLVIPFQAWGSLYFVRRHISVDWIELAGAMWKAAAICLCSAIGPLSVVGISGFRFDLPIGSTLIAFVLAAAGWLAAIRITHHPLLQEIHNVVRVVRAMFLERFALRHARSID
jgi:O-antigen/teichoic acid export membrane protein